MKKIIFTLFIFILFLACQEPVTIYENYYGFEIDKTMKLVQIFPKNAPALPCGEITVKNHKDLDFANGIMYDENAYQNDGIVHEIDLSDFLKKRTDIIFVYCEWIGGNTEEFFYSYFNSKNIISAQTQIYTGKNIEKRLHSILVDSENKLQWYHTYHHAFDGRLPGADPGYYDWGATKFKIMMYYYEANK